MTEHSVRPDTAHALLARAARGQVEGRAPSTSVGIVRDGALVWSAGRGAVDGAEPTTDTQYRIGSITKPFTAVLVLQLRDAGRVDLDASLDTYVDGTPFGHARVRELLAHAAGLAAEPPGSWWEREAGGPWSELAATLGPELLLETPGRFHYSNTGYAALGELVARLHGRSWYEVLRSELLEPLGMTRTTYDPEPPSAPGLAVHPFADVVMAEAVQDHGSMAPAGQLWSTVGDLARWARFLLGETGDVLAPESLAEMRRAQVTAVDGGTYAGYGLGLQVLPFGDRSLVGHGGSVPGFVAFIVVDVARRTGAVELANTTAGRPFCAPDLLSILEQHEPTVPPAWTPLADPPEGWDDVVGLWHWGPGAYHLRMVGADRLEMTAAVGPGRASSFVRRGGEWVGTSGYWEGERLEVVRRDDGSVSHLDAGTFVLTRAPYDPTAPIPGGVSDDPWSTHRADG